MKKADAVTRTVQRGFITRMNSAQEEWEEQLVLLPEGTELIDGDATPFYREREDGKLWEYYGWTVEPGMKIYGLAANFCEDWEFQPID